MSEATQNAKLLILDDDEKILEILERYLSEEGRDVTLVCKAELAQEHLKSGTYALMITDLNLPDMDGLDMVQFGKELDQDMSVIVLTAMLDVQSAIDAIRAGADDYLLKPFNLKEISFAVDKALERRRLLISNREHQEKLEMRVREATQGLELANKELMKTKEYLESLLQSSVDLIATVDTEGKVSYANQRTSVMLGYTPEEMLGMAVENFYATGVDDAETVRTMLGRDRRVENYETEMLHKDGSRIPVNMSVSRVKDEEGEVVSYLVICKDITKQKRLEQELKELSIKDNLTGLYNQRYFYTRLEMEIDRATRQKHPLCLMLFDVDQFKQYNDRHGHLEGDNVLRAAGQVVRECTRENVDAGFRYGGDEFTIILPETTEVQACTVADRIRKSFESYAFDHLTLSIGLKQFKEGESIESLIRFADAMMYDAKRNGGDQVHTYSGQAISAAKPSSGLAQEQVNNPKTRK
jgi:diguanylate cyclase (GGDEF)-like protein/PAS domain S-box-containing protein